jgi:hypothetical protein
VTLTHEAPSRTFDEAEVLFREARQRRRRRRLISGGIVGLVIASLVLGLALVPDLGRVGQPPLPYGPPPPSIPLVSSHGDRTTIIIRLPDGRGFSLQYPKNLNLGVLSLTVGGEVSWSDSTGSDSCCSQYLSPVEAPVSSLFSGRPLAIYRGAHGVAVPYFAGTQAEYPYTSSVFDYLAFTFGPWTVLVPDRVESGDFIARMSPEQRSTWVAAFGAHKTAGGYLIFSPRAPLQVVRGSLDVVLRTSADLIEISGPQTCSSTQGIPELIPAGRAWCDAASRVRVSVTGPSAQVDGIASSLRIRALAPVT